jgi:hypothetical protein
MSDIGCRVMLVGGRCPALRRSVIFSCHSPDAEWHPNGMTPGRIWVERISSSGRHQAQTMQASLA